MAAVVNKKQLHLCLLKNTAIWEQLAIEEALLRTDDGNWCLINEGSTPAVVMGISGKLEEHVDSTVGIPIIRRFSGGGTVVVDASTFFVTFIFQKEELDLGHCPRRVMSWTEELYRPVFDSLPLNFRLVENDYVIGERKIGGNAQYFTKNRWLHHTTFLWDYNKEHMSLLKMPPKAPAYRQSRHHEEFLTTLKEFFPTMTSLQEKLLTVLQERFLIDFLRQNEIPQILERPHRRSVAIL